MFTVIAIDCDSVDSFVETFYRPSFPYSKSVTTEIKASLRNQIGCKVGGRGALLNWPTASHTFL